MKSKASIYSSLLLVLLFGTAVGFPFAAGDASRSSELHTTEGAEVKLAVSGIVESTSGGFRFPDGSTQAEAAAGDGKYEINQEDAVIGGFPIMITTSGGYRLTTNIVVPDIATTAIEITADNVSLDLNGFTILGPRVTGNGAGKGIFSDAENISVTNGTVSGLGDRGIDIGNFAHVDNVHAINNGIHGIDAGYAARITNNNCSQNGADGFNIEYASVVSDNIAFANGRYGITVDGLGGSSIINNVAYDNTDNGINSGNGSVVIGNAVRLNDGDGMHLGGFAGYAHNVMLGNLGDPLAGGGLQMGEGVNVCDNMVCP